MSLKAEYKQRCLKIERDAVAKAGDAPLNLLSLISCLTDDKEIQKKIIETISYHDRFIAIAESAREMREGK